MEENRLYFLKNQYFEMFNLPVILTNKQSGPEGKHNRPCYYAFREGVIFWMIPISSQCDKYEQEYKKSIEKYGLCDSLVFLYVKGNKNVALIQNMIPVTEKYIENIYTYHGTNIPIEINDKKRKELNAKARKVVRMARQGKKLTFTPILELERKLLSELAATEDLISLL